MKTKNLITFIFILISEIIFGQQATVTVGFKDSQIHVNNITQPINMPVQIGSNNSINTKFIITLDKPSTYSIGESRLFVRVYNNTGQYTDLASNTYVTVSTSTFQTSAVVGFDVNIQASSINFGDGNYLMATLQAVNSGATWTSPKITISKSPVFSINPSNVEIPCGSTDPITFNCISNISSGTYSYSWNVGNGWSHNGTPVSGNITTTNNSITLQPTNPNILPSSISVTPTWNNMVQNSITSTVKRKVFDENITINGAENICSYPSNSTYSVNTTVGSNIIWTSSDNTIAEVINITGANATLNIKKPGPFILTANVTNSCNQNKVLIKKIWVGKPSAKLQLESVNNYVYLDVIGTNGLNINEQKITNVTWEKISSSGGCIGSLSGSDFSGLAHGNCFSWTVRVRITLTNSCGTTIIEQDVTPRAPDPCNTYRLSKINNGNSNTFRIIQPPCDNYRISSNQKPNENFEVKIFNTTGHQILSTNKSEFSIDHLLKGSYYIQIIKDNKLLHAQTIIKE